MSNRKTTCYCDVCGVSSSDKPVYFSKQFNKLLCGKHLYELKKFGEIKNPTQYNRFDKNRYRVENGIVYMDICDAHQNKICETMFDEHFLSMMTQRKWRITYKRGKQYVVTAAYPEEKTAHITMHRYAMSLAGYEIDGHEIDHINGDTLDNRICNLRIATRHEQVSNIAPRKTNQFGIRGISYDKRYNSYVVDFRLDGKRLYYKQFKELADAVYVRYLSEKYYFDDIAVARHLPSMQPYIDMLSDQRKQELDEYVSMIIRRKEVSAS